MKTARRTILSIIDEHDGPVPITGVVDAALGKHEPTAVFEAFAALIREGEIYEPETNHVRRTVRGE